MISCIEHLKQVLQKSWEDEFKLNLSELLTECLVCVAFTEVKALRGTKRFRKQLCKPRGKTLSAVKGTLSS